MAKKIKIIKCPQCGSLKNTLVRDDLYKCDHCRTDFILDNDDVNIVINEEQIYNSPATNLPGNNRKVIVVGNLIVIALFLLFILVPLFFLTPKNSGVGIISDNYSSNMLADLILTDRQSSKVHYMLAESRIYSVGYGEKQDSRTGFYLVFYDLISKKEEKSVFLEPLPSTKTGVECKIQAFENGNTYIIVNRKKLMAVNPEKGEVSAVPPALLGSYPELKSGVGNIDFTRSDDTDGFVIITNDGKLYNLYSLEDKIYAKEDLSEHIKTLDASKRKQQIKIPENALLLYTDKEHVLVQQIDEKNPKDHLISRLNQTDENILWQLKTKHQIKDACLYKNGWILKSDYKSFLLVDFQGKITENIKLK